MKKVPVIWLGVAALGTLIAVNRYRHYRWLKGSYWDKDK